MFVGTCAPLATLPGDLEAGQSLSEFFKDFPSVTRGQAAVSGAESLQAGCALARAGR